MEYDLMYLCNMAKKKKRAKKYEKKLSIKGTLDDVLMATIKQADKATKK